MKISLSDDKDTSFGGCDDEIAAAAKANSENMAKLGLNIEYMDDFYAALKAYRDVLVSDNPKECDLIEAFEKYVKVSKMFINSQPGLENFLTDENKKKDPFLANIYAYFDMFIEGGRQLIKDCSLVDEYFGKNTGDFFAKFVMEFAKVTNRAKLQKP